MFLTELTEQQSKNLLVIYPGRFQPWHRGHRAVYDHLVGRYGKNNVFISTSNKIDPPRSPFDFSEKLDLINATGVDSSRVVKTAQPYQSQELVAKYDPEETVLIFAVSEKDMAEDPRFKFKAKRDGSPSYFQPLPADITDAKPLSQHGYITTVPTFDFNLLGKPVRSATEIRNLFTASNPETRKKIVTALYGKYSDRVYEILAGNLAEDTQDTSNNGDPDVDPKIAYLSRKAQIEHPYASSPDEALALYIIDREERDIDRLKKADKREDEMLDRMQEVDQELKKQFADLRSEFEELKARIDPKLQEAAGVGVVAKNNKQAKDPRYSMSITQDVKPGTDKKNQRAMRLIK